MSWGVADAFYSHFGLASRDDLPGMDELRAAGLLDRRPAISIYSDQARDDLLPVDEDGEDAEALMEDAPDGIDVEAEAEESPIEAEESSIKAEEEEPQTS